MPIDHDRLMEILGDALEASPEQRAALIARACGNDTELRSEIERLLARQADADAALNQPGLAFEWAGDALSSRGGRSSRAAREGPDLSGTTIGPYELIELAGRGGMGVVYRGRDKRLNRPVAVKSLPPGLNDAPDRLARFAREARLLSQLSNPCVATVYGLEENDTGRYLVMEWVEGQTLATKLSRGPLPMEEAIRVCSQIAAGLAAAHDLGVVHRDVKPTNVMLTTAGQVKLLDFGLARRTADDQPRGDTADNDPDTALPDAADSADLSITLHHQIVGTPRYMSPEQLRGEPIDRRTDVFAFGCVMYECIVGRPAFDGTSTVAIAASVIEREPDFSRLPSRTPPTLRKLLSRCLAKDPPRRLRDLNDARLELEDALVAREWTDVRAASGAASARGATPWRWAAVLLIAAAAGTAGWLIGRRQPAMNAAPPPEAAVQIAAPLSRFSIPFPQNVPQSELARLGVALSPDGEHLLVSANDGVQRQIWHHRRQEDEFVPIDGTIRAWLPSFSADGEWITYFQEGGIFKRRLQGGASHRIARVSGYWGTFALGPDDIATFVPVWGKGIARASTNGTPVFITTVDPNQQEFSHISPSLTPDYRNILFTVWDGKMALRVDACALDGSNRRNVIPRGSGARAARTPLGPAIVYERDGGLFASLFDVDRCATVGGEVKIADSVLWDQSLFRPAFAVSDEGTLAYIPGRRFTEESRFAYMTGSDQSEPIGSVRGPFMEPTVTADGARVSAILKGEIYRPCIYYLKESRLEPIEIEGDCSSAAISPDGRTLAYTSNRNGPYGIWLRELATGMEQQLLQGKTDVQRHLCWSPDGRHLAFDMSASLEATRDIYVLEVQSHEVRRIPAYGDDRAARISPSGRWLAYVSDETGRQEVYIRPFADDAANPTRLTREGGDWPVWSTTDDQLYFRSKDRIWQVGIDPENGTASGTPVASVQRDIGQSDFDGSDYVVAGDGRIIVIEPSERGPKVDQIRVILNWHRLLLPTR